ncbi:MAG: S8 family serine peptidase, partial [Frankiales bacterium]|nr:S8 family serine peptidase [Frankiales bacterium]
SVLHHSTDLGPSRAKSVSLLVALHPGGAAALRTWATARGLRVSDVYASAATLSGSPRALDAALGVAIRDWRSPGGTPFLAARSEAAVPPELTAAVSGFGRISTLRFGGSVYRAPKGVPPKGLSPSDILRSYNALPLQQAGDFGAGQTVVVFEWNDGFNQKSLDTFDTMFNLPSFSPEVVGKLTTTDEVETDMDIETIHAVAPGAKIVYVDVLNYAAGNDNATFADVFHKAFQDIDHRYPGAIWSASLGFCEFLQFQPSELPALDADVAAAEAHGTTFFASSGDTGGLDCTPPKSIGEFPGEQGKGVEYPALLAHTTGVGGTTLSVTASGDYADEATWTSAILSQGTGGGVSQVIPRPSWQAGQGVGDQGAGTQFREVPDIAAVADPASGTIVISAGASSDGKDPTAETAGGGTSLSAPMWAGFTALMNVYLQQHGGKAVGFLNPTLYYLFNHPPQFPPFHDVTLGNNDFYVATPGYDPVTGLGTPNVAYLTQDILALQKGGKS